jgi:hypothetical protein
MCTVILPPSGYPIAVNKYIILLVNYGLTFRRHLVRTVVGLVTVINGIVFGMLQARAS